MTQEVTLENITKNGSGKTMLMRVIAGLVSPSTGKLLFDGKNRADANCF